MNEGDVTVEELLLDHDFYKHRRDKPLFPQDRDDNDNVKRAAMRSHLGLQQKPLPTVAAEPLR